MPINKSFRLVGNLTHVGTVKALKTGPCPDKFGFQRIPLFRGFYSFIDYYDVFEQ
jgi:hypothetical protein